MFDKAMKKSIQPFLEPGEELLDVAIVQGKGMSKALFAGGAIGQSAIGAMKDKKAVEGDVQLSSKMGLAVTSQRLLIFKAGGAMTLSAKELLTAIPVQDVDSIDVGKGALTKPITLSIRGQAFDIEAPRAVNTDRLVSAFQHAKANASVHT
jgi:hypothetical protein